MKRRKEVKGKGKEKGIKKKDKGKKGRKTGGK